MEDTQLQGLILADIAPDPGWDFDGAVVMARKGAQLLVAARLPVGRLFDPNNDAHVLGWLVANAARDFIPMAHEMYRRHAGQDVASQDQFILQH